MSGSSFGRGDYSSGYVSGYTTDNIFFETENGERAFIQSAPRQKCFCGWGYGDAHLYQN